MPAHAGRRLAVHPVSRGRTVRGWTAVAGSAVTVLAHPATAQVVRDPPVAYRELRFEDTALPPGDWADRFKRISLGPDAWVSFGGGLRERYDYYAAPRFGLAPQRRDAALLSRMLLQADVRASDTVRAFVQFGTEAQSGRRGPALPTDVNRLDLAQAFLDLSADAGPGRLTLRPGRQELAFGAERLISVRESPNIRQSFDGGRATYRAGTLTLDLFGVKPVQNRRGVLDDTPAGGQWLWGLYGTAPLPALPQASLDAYYIGRSRQGAAYARGTAQDVRHTLGLRLWRKQGPFDYDVEASFQTGSFGQAPVRAWAFGSDTGYTLAALPLKPRLGLKLDAASGDGGGRTLGTFDPLFPKCAYFTEAQLTEFMNVVSVFPSLTLAVSDRFAVTAGVDLLWRQSTRDAVYFPPLTPLPGTAGRGGHRVGTQTNLQAEWLIGEHLDLNAVWVHAIAGPALRPAGGRDTDYLGAWTSFRF